MALFQAPASSANGHLRSYSRELCRLKSRILLDRVGGWRQLLKLRLQKTKQVSCKRSGLIAKRVCSYPGTMTRHGQVWNKSCPSNHYRILVLNQDQMAPSSLFTLTRGGNFITFSFLAMRTKRRICPWHTTCMV